MYFQRHRVFHTKYLQMISLEILSKKATVDRKDWINMWRTLESQARNTIDKHMTNATDEAAFVKF